MRCLLSLYKICEEETHYKEIYGILLTNLGSRYSFGKINCNKDS